MSLSVLFDEKSEGHGTGQVPFELIGWFLALYLTIYLLVTPIKALAILFHKRSQDYQKVTIRDGIKQDQRIERDFLVDEEESKLIDEGYKLNNDQHPKPNVLQQDEGRLTGLKTENGRSSNAKWIDSRNSNDAHSNDSRILIINSNQVIFEKLDFWDHKVCLNSRECLDPLSKVRYLQLNLRPFRFVRKGKIEKPRLLHLMRLINFISASRCYDVLYLFNLDHLSVFEQVLIFEGLKSKSRMNSSIEERLRLVFVVTDLDKVIAHGMRLVNQTHKSQNYRVLFKELQMVSNSLNIIAEETQSRLKISSWDFRVDKNEDIYRVLRSLDYNHDFKIDYANMLVVRP